MPALIDTIKPAFVAYGRPALLALLLHALLLMLILTRKFSPVVKPAPAPAIVSYLYQPAPVAAPPVEPAPETVAEKPVPLTEQLPPVVNEVSTPITAKGSAHTLENSSTKPATAVNDDAKARENTETTENTSLIQRALNQAGAVSGSQQAAMTNAASAAYQQFLREQQQPRITVEPQHQQLSQDPAKQVIAQLDDGRQLIRSKGGCRIVDPTKDGFEGLMATRAVPCGDEVSNSELLKQALEKHRKR